jgi:hypothetical protein
MEDCSAVICLVLWTCRVASDFNYPRDTESGCGMEVGLNASPNGRKMAMSVAVLTRGVVMSKPREYINNMLKIGCGIKPWLFVRRWEFFLTVPQTLAPDSSAPRHVVAGAVHDHLNLRSTITKLYQIRVLRLSKGVTLASQVRLQIAWVKTITTRIVT